MSKDGKRKNTGNGGFRKTLDRDDKVNKER